MQTDLTMFSGSSNRELSAATARCLGVELGACAIARFPDTEASIEILDPVRGRDVIVIQSTSPPVDENIVELLSFADACRRASAHRVTAIVPYFGYARSDKRLGRREPIAASMIAGLMQAVGIDHVVTVDVHTPQLEGFFHAPFDNISAVRTICDAMAGSISEDAVVVAPDAGRVPMATQYAVRLDRPLVLLHKRRLSGSQTAVAHVVGDVAGRSCILVDDMVTTGGTIVESIRTLRECGATGDVTVVTTHALLVGDALARLREAGVERIVATDSVAHAPEVAGGIETISIAPLLAEAITQITTGGSLRFLHE